MIEEDTYRVLMHKRRLALLISYIPVILLGVDVQGVVMLQREGGGGGWKGCGRVYGTGSVQERRNSGRVDAPTLCEHFTSLSTISLHDIIISNASRFTCQ